MDFMDKIAIKGNIYVYVCGVEPYRTELKT